MALSKTKPKMVSDKKEDLKEMTHEDPRKMKGDKKSKKQKRG